MKQIYLTAMFTLAGCTLSAQTPADSTTLQSLLTEVRQLRLALEKATFFGPRMQVAIERLRIQDDKVTRLSRELGDVRRELSAVTSDQARMTEELQNIEQRISSEASGSELRKQLEQQRAEIKLNFERFAARITDLKVRESDGDISLQQERRTLLDMNEKLNAMERQLEPTPSKQP